MLILLDGWLCLIDSPNVSPRKYASDVLKVTDRTYRYWQSEQVHRIQKSTLNDDHIPTAIGRRRVLFCKRYLTVLWDSEKHLGVHDHDEFLRLRKQGVFDRLSKQKQWLLALLVFGEDIAVKRHSWAGRIVFALERNFSVILMLLLVLAFVVGCFAAYLDWGIPLLESAIDFLGRSLPSTSPSTT